MSERREAVAAAGSIVQETGFSRTRENPHLPYHHHHHHHLAITELGHLLTPSGFTQPEVSSTVSPGFFCIFVCSFLLSSVICYEAFCLHVVLVNLLSTV